ncbi:MAG: GNAT family N-acetyltransferase [Parachlamydiaceae bacterium]
MISKDENKVQANNCREPSNYDRNSLKIRVAERTEIAWINDCYDKVEFIHSHFDSEIIAIAEFDGEKEGLGRLVKVDEKNLELGGMYVFEAFRGKGIAKEIVSFLLTYVKPSQTVYCIPFEHLLDFYKQCGFVNCFKFESVPKTILDKYYWCQKKYTHPTALLVLELNSHKKAQEKVRDLEDILLQESKIGQFEDGIGAFANRNFKKGEVVIKWNLKVLSNEEYENLPEYEKNNFCHQRNGIHCLYPDPERHVNRFHSPNVI